MKKKFTVSLDCGNTKDAEKYCSSIIYKAINAVYPFTDNNGNVFGHVSILHEKNNHVLWIYYYDKDGEHESESSDLEEAVPSKSYWRTKTVKDGDKEITYGYVPRKVIQSNSKVKMSPRKPTESELRSVINSVITNGKLKLTKINETKTV